ncbi:MAG: polysaccharide pyruvyl transferase family protein [Verrucomicrobiales bacterium]
MQKSAFHAVGLSELETLDEVRKSELLRVLGEADFLGVRDSTGADFLEKEGLSVERMPCGVTMLPRVCRKVWAKNETGSAMAAVKERFPNGWISVQVSGYRKKTFKPLIKSIAEKCARMNLGVVFFAAGTATGHDDVVELAKRANSFPENGAMFFPFRNIWDISSLISESQMCIGTSLHGRIVAMSAGIPRINLAVNFTKIKSYCRLWEHSAVPFELTAEQLGDHFENLIEMDRGMLKAHSLWLQESYLTSFEKMCQATGLKQADLVALSDGNHGEALKNSQSLMSEWASDPKTLKTLKRISRRRKKRREGVRATKSKPSSKSESTPLSRLPH